MTKTIGVATALALVFGSASAAFACEGFWCGGYGGNNGSSQTFTTVTNVSVSNSATVNNNVKVEAETGENDANGGNASGQNANGGTGGTIDTGNATALSLIANDVNSTLVEVVAPENCGCDEGGDLNGEGYGRHGKKKGGDKKEVYTELNVSLGNSAYVNNNVEVEAETGENDANGGNAEASQEDNYKGWWGKHKKGKSEANGGHGGLITTGDAEASSGIVNLINSVILRIL